MADPILAWHFVGDRLRDGRPVPPDGEWLVHDGPLKLCVSGLHASLDPWDALPYAPGPILCRVELAGAMVHGDEKCVAERRRIVARRDATETLCAFARACARDVLHLWDAPDVVRRYLDTGDDTIRAVARDVARDAAWAAAWDAAWDAVRDAARAAAARDAAARDAAVWDAARAAAGAAAARAAQGQRWADMVAALFAEEAR